MRLFLDTSVLLSASVSATGASREIFRCASSNGWTMIITPYVLEEVLRNISDLGPSASAGWPSLQSSLVVMEDVVTIDGPAIFGKAKDRPILFSALAWADILLTLDEADFGAFMEKPFYGLLVMRPGSFLRRERDAGRLR